MTAKYPVGLMAAAHPPNDPSVGCSRCRSHPHDDLRHDTPLLARRGARRTLLVVGLEG